MPTAIGQFERRMDVPAPHLTARDVVLLRVVAGGATRADLQRDCAPLLAPRISGTEFRRAAELAISTLAGTQLVTETKGRLMRLPRAFKLLRPCCIRLASEHRHGPT